MKTRILLIGLCVLGWAAYAQATIIYDAVADFSATSNPNGAWIYGHGTNPNGSNFTTFLAPSLGPGQPSLDMWITAPSTWDPNVVHNSSGATIDAFNIYFRPDHLNLGPSNSGADVRWIAPQAGTVDISAEFNNEQWRSSGQTPNLYIVHNSTSLWSKLGVDYGVSEWPVDGTPVAYAGTGISVAAGDTITFMAQVEYWASYASTGFTGTIDLTPIPEPSSLLLLGTGLVGLLAYAWRKRK